MARLPEPSISTKLARVQRFFDRDVEAFKQVLGQLETEIDAKVKPQHNDTYHQRVLKAFQASQAACRVFEEENRDDPAVIVDVQEGFRKETEPWFRQSWIAHRSRTKPSGFAGDFEMLIKLYEQQTPARGLGGYLDLCILDLPLARAVRSRLVATRKFLVREVGSRSENVRILDIACGPCREYQDWPDSTGDRRVEIVAIDNDPFALKFVAEHVGKNLIAATTLQATRYNALRTRSASTTTRKFGKFDIIYSVGLCDYLSDHHLVGMLSAWRETLNDGGVLYIAFKDTEQYDKTPYQWHLDWFFYQRTRQDVVNLYKSAGFNINRLQTTRDDTGIIINVIDRRPTTESLARFDDAEQTTPAESRRQRAVVPSPVGEQ